ncbi:MAG: hypothetical protein HYY17_04740 [Planctomycetes bacterium]|nr:hypothetical protein [Planctomycetota bacterium]
MLRHVRDFLLRTALIVGVGLGIAWASGADRPARAPRPAVEPLADPGLREEARRLLESDEAWILADDVRFLPALIDLLDSDAGRGAGEAIALALRYRGITDEQGKAPVEAHRLGSTAYRRAQRRSLAAWYVEHGAALRASWRPRPVVACPF